MIERVGDMFCYFFFNSSSVASIVVFFVLGHVNILLT